MGKTQIVALDKTGTITQGKPKVTDIIPVNGRSEKELLSIAYALEKKASIHWQEQSIKRPNRMD